MTVRVVSAFILFFFLSLNYTLVAQEKGLKLTHKQKDRLKFLKENRRIKVFTKDGNKYKGRFSIIDSETIEIKGEKIDLANISVIRKKDIGTSITKVVGLGIGTSVIIASAVSSNIFTILIGTTFGIGFDILALAVPEIAIGELDNQRWSYSTIN